MKSPLPLHSVLLYSLLCFSAQHLLSVIGHYLLSVSSLLEAL